MINILLHFTGNEANVKNASESEDTPFAFVKLERMNNVYSLFIKTKEDFIAIRAKVKNNDNATIIGGWNKRGRFITLPNAEDNFTRAKLRQRMKRFIRRNLEGEVIEDREYTNQELSKGVINKIFGWPDREF